VTADTKAELTLEEREELATVARLSAKPIPSPEALGLRLWLFGWINAVNRYAAGDPPRQSPPQLKTVLDAFTTIGRQVAGVVEDPRPLSANTFSDLLDAAQGLEIAAAAACQALPPHEQRTAEEQAAHEVAMMAQGLPFQLCVYAKAAGGMLQ